jgi:hypothetical protein
VYVPVWTGRFYQVWQRPTYAGSIIEHLPLGSRLQPAAVPTCEQLVAMARLAAGENGELAAVERPPAIVIEPDGTVGQPSVVGKYGESPESLYLTAPYSSTASFSVPASARYGVWVGGTFKSAVEIVVDGRQIGAARDSLNWPDTFTTIGSIILSRGQHSLDFRYTGPGVRPGSSGTPPFGVGPIVLSSATEDSAVTYVHPPDVRSLCGKSLDWVEALRG